MSALVEEAIRLYRAEERKLTETIWLYKELLRSMKTRVKVSSEAETPDSIKDQGIPLKDRQELELLEQVLKKALKIRSSSAVILNYQENPCSSGSVDKAPAVKGRDKRNCQKSSLLSSELKGSHQHEGQLKSTAGCGNDATCQVPVKTGRSSRLTVRGKHSAAMEEELDVLTQLGLDLTHCYNADLQIHQLGWSPDWERKMAWWYGALCPLHSRVEWHSSERPCIPPLLAYSSKGELEELQSLRLYVSQLKLEIHAHQMGCTTGHLACQPQPSSSTSQDGQTLEGRAKVPDVLSSLERLSQATGGMEKSWYRCIFPFGIISLVIGIAGTGVTYTYNDLPQTKVVSVVLLIVGLVLVGMATACWSAHKKKRRKKKEGDPFTTEQCPL
ncbi:transmembrane protein 100-like [Silurus meridionalis]|nr:transmembrane protein 100-like [Silurus meridionalis]